MMDQIVEAMPDEPMPTWAKVLLTVLVVGTVSLLATDLFLGRDRLRGPARIVSGPHSGRSGNVASISWFANGWNTRASVNVPANENEIRELYGSSADKGWADDMIEDMQEGHGPRTWVECWSWQLEPQDSASGGT